MVSLVQTAILVLSFLVSTAMAAEEASSTIAPPPIILFQQPGDQPFSATSLLAPILINLGFQEFAMAFHALSAAPTLNTWTGPSTIFALTDSSIHSCPSCSIPRLLQEHTVPGLFSSHHLRNLAFGTKIETSFPGRCITVTSASNNSKIFIEGVEITHPDLFNNGFILVHGLDGFASHLSPFSCNVERFATLSFSPPQPSDSPQVPPPFSVIRLMLSDAMLRLRISGFGILALAMRVKYAELVQLQNMTVFALDDATIFSGGREYISNVRFHIVPNMLLMADDLNKLPVQTVLPTLEHGQTLKVTDGGGGSNPMRINYVRLKSPDIVHNLKIVVHSLFLPFPHLQPRVEGTEGREWNAAGPDVMESNGEMVDMDPTREIIPTDEIEIEDHHGL